jgi:hypothetical protein
MNEASAQVLSRSLNRASAKQEQQRGKIGMISRNWRAILN